MNTSPIPAKSYIRRETLIGCVVNATLATMFAVLLFSQLPIVPVWGANGIAMDLLPTVFILTSLGGLALSIITKQRLNRGIVEPWRPAVVQRFPVFLASYGVILRVLIVTLGMTLTIVPVTWLALEALGIDSLDFTTFVGFKVLYAPITGAISAPWFLKAALVEPTCVTVGRPTRT